MWDNRRATSLLGIKYPIIQGPFGGRFSSVELVSTVSDLGGMGSFGLNAYDPKEILEVDEQIKQLTKKTYALNLWVPLEEDPVHTYSAENFDVLKKLFRPYFDEMQIPLPDAPELRSQNFGSQVEAVLKARPPVVSFIFGIPSSEIIVELKKRNIISIATATTLEEAMLIAEAGMDLVVASGLEAGGHRASFLKPAEDSLSSTKDLVQQVTASVHLPVIAAGGISNRKDIVEVLKCGASAVQMGTAFLATEESNASVQHKSALLSTQLLKTDLTKIYSGRLARVISNELTTALNIEDEAIVAPYPLQGVFLNPLLKAAIDQDRWDYVAFWSGQPSAVLKHKSAKELFDSIVKYSGE